MNEKKILLSLNKQVLKSPPVWLMRQAGRYLKEYRDVRKKAGGFLELCYNPILAKEVTLQPIRRFGFDAAILFADILLLPQALGRKLWFETGEGPRLEPINDIIDVNNLNNIDYMNKNLQSVYETVKLVKSELSNDKALIGFAGAPWTVLTYMIAGKGGDEQKAAKIFMTTKKEIFDLLMEKVTIATVEYLSKQIESGADVIKLFDSWAGSLGGTYFTEYVIKPLEIITSELKKRHGNVPIIAFPRGAGARYKKFITMDNISCLALDTTVSPEWAKHEIQPFKPLQGNLDPIHLITGGDEMIKQIDHLMESFSSGPYIFNLGHGITPDAKPGNIEVLLKRLSK